MTLMCRCIHDLKGSHEREFEITVADHCEWWDIEQAAMRAHGKDIGVHIDFPHLATCDFTSEEMRIVSPLTRIIVWVRHTTFCPYWFES